MGGTLYFAPTQKAGRLLTLWEQELAAHVDMPDNMALSRALMGWKGRQEPLPVEYCRLYGNDLQGLTPPVIEHLQVHQAAQRAEVQEQPTQQDKPTIICFYTQGTSYEAEAQEMRATVEPHGFTVDIRPVSDLGSWQANTYRKAAFLEAMLKELRRPVIWMDADSRMRQYPWFFDEWVKSDSDFTVCWIDWSQFIGIKRNDRELDSAVMGLKPTPAVFDVLTRWQTLNRQVMHTGIFEQKNLEKILAIGDHDMTIMELPMSHCQIFDTMAALGEPVIEQMQASRRLKNERALSTVAEGVYCMTEAQAR